MFLLLVTLFLLSMLQSSNGFPLQTQMIDTHKKGSHVNLFCQPVQSPTVSIINERQIVNNNMFHYSRFNNPPNLLEASQRSSLLLASANKFPDIEVKTQMDQIRDALVLKTMIGTEWRIIEDRGNAMKLSPSSPSCIGGTVVFRGFFEEPNKGIFKYVSRCGEESTGRWITKPSQIRNGNVELSARWKVKLPAGQFIYKGFIQTRAEMGRNGAVSAEMSGLILTGTEVGKEKLVGKFRADLVRQFDPTNENIAGTGGISEKPISMMAK